MDMSVIEGAGCDNKTARYELFAIITHQVISPVSPLHLPCISPISPIITHQGRTAEGGHYVAWVKKDKAMWLVFDDETVAEIPAERIKELYGGGDWHMAYMCFYRKMDGLTLD